MYLRLPRMVKYILDLLQNAGYEAYAVGGCVRDSILAREPMDWDITTSARPEEIKRIFRRTVDTGIQHGTVTVLAGDGAYEVTTYRIDGRYLDGRHPESVTFTRSLEEDLKRRDFTINAMAYNEKDGLVDLYGGMQDLQRKIIRCVGNPDERFDEDALRILRAVRFSAQLGFSIDPGTRTSIKGHAEDLRKISAERIRTELEKLLLSPHPEELRTLCDLGIAAVILPEFDRCRRTKQRTPHHAYDVGEHTVRTVCAAEEDRVIRLTMLLHDIGKPYTKTTDENGHDHFKGHAAKGAEMADEVLRRLKFDNDTRNKVVTLVRWHDLRPKPEPAAVRKAVVRVGQDLFIPYLKVQWADTCGKSSYRQEEKFERIREVHEVYEQILKAGDCLTLRDLAINGTDLKEEGFEGAEIGQVLKEALRLVLEDPEANSRELLLEYARYRKLKNDETSLD